MTDAPRILGAVTVYQPIDVVDIAEQGIRIEAGFPLQNDSLHDFRLALGPRSVIVKGRIARCEIGDLRDGQVRYRCAIEFVDPAPHALSAIRDFVVAHRAPPAPPKIVDGEIAGDP